MKKTLLVTLDYPPSIGGVANYYKNMVDNLNPEKIVILTNQENKLLTRLPIWPKWLPSFINIYKTVKNENIEMILVGQILPLGTVVWLLSKILKTPYIIMTHAMDVTYPLKYPQKKWLIKKILNKAFRVTTVSRFTEKQLKNLMTGRNLAKIETIYPCPNLNISDLNEHKYQELKDKFKSNNEKIILSVGRIVKRKGFDTMIDVVTQLDKEYKNFKYLIIGEGEYKKELLAKTNHHIKFINNVPDNELSAYYKLADVFAMPARHLSDNDVEGFGIVFLEANLFGKPVIAGDSGGIRDAVIDGQTGFLVDPEDKNMIKDAILKIFNDPEKGKQMGEAGKQRVLKEFTWKNQTEKLIKILS